MPVTEDMKLDQEHCWSTYWWLIMIVWLWGEKERIKFNFVCIAL